MKFAITPARGLRRVWLVLIGLVFAGPTVPQAGEATERDLLPEDAVFVLEVQQPLAWAGHPLVKQVWAALSESGAIRARLETPEFERLRGAQEFLEQAAGRNWQEALEQLTSGGTWLAFTPKPHERLMLIATAAEEGLWNRLEAAVLKARETAGRSPPPAHSHRGVTGYRWDKSFVAIVGPRLVAASHEEDFKRAVNQLLDNPPKPNPPKSSAEINQPAKTNPSIKLNVALDKVRLVPAFRDALERPAKDAGQVALLGGWADVLREADRLALELRWPDQSSELQLQVEATGVLADDLLTGFFVPPDGSALAPLLEPTGTIYSASWFRDYAGLWNQRANVLDEPALKKLEKGDTDVQTQFSQFGVKFTPSRLFQQFGTQFRAVLARSGPSGYRVELENKLPAAAVCVSLREEAAFSEQAEPLSRAIGLIAAFGQSKMLTRKSEHAQAKLTGLWFRDDEKATTQGNRVRFNFNPTWTVTRGHFIVGSTREIVERVIDELDRLSALDSSAQSKASASRQVTERQTFSFSEAANALEDFREAILQGTAFDRGLSLTEAAREVDVAAKVLESFGKLTTEAAFTESGFEYLIRLQKERRIED